MDCRRFDVGVITGDKINPMHRVIHDKTATWMTHCVTFKDAAGNLWDPRMAGIEDNNISLYRGRPLTIHRYNEFIDYDKLEEWVDYKFPRAKGYDFLALAGFLLGIESFQNDDRWYCSEWPYRLHQDTGHRITRTLKPFFYPSDIFYDDKFDLVWEGVVA
jgi:hypothetical protein